MRTQRGDLALFAVARLQALQQQMVGGENVDNSEVKERHHLRKLHAEDQRKKQLVREWPLSTVCAGRSLGCKPR